MTLVLLIVVVVWVALPFVPAVHEAVRGLDARSLPVSEAYREDVRLDAPPSPDGPTTKGGKKGARRPRATFVGTPGLEADEVLARRTARLKAGSTVRRRLRAGTAAEVDPGSVLRGSAEAGDHMWLGADVQFERVHAPTIDIGVSLAGDAPTPPPAVDVALPADAVVLAGRALVHGDLSLPPGARLDATLVVTGDLRLGEGAHVCGDVKAHGTVTLAQGAGVTGNVFSRGDVTLADHATVTGAAGAEKTLRVGAGAVVGRPDAPTTATGRAVLLASGARVHGTLWAEASGQTLSAEVPEREEATGEGKKTLPESEIEPTGVGS